MPAHADRVVVLDGGTGSELRRRGVPLDATAWTGPASLTHFDTLASVHTDYVRAGAEVITTNTFGTTRFVLEAAGFGDRFEQINRAAVAAAQRARDAAGSRVHIAGSISCLPPGFDIGAYPSPSVERDAYRELATLLAEAGVDLIVLEMMEEHEHAHRACEAVRQVGLPFWLGVSTRLGRDGQSVVAYDFPRTRLSSLLDELLDYAPAVVNVMHTPLDAVELALAEVRMRWQGLTGVYPELEEASAPDGKKYSIADPERLAELALQWIDSGARLVGGCCGATPDHIRAIARAVAEEPA